MEKCCTNCHAKYLTRWRNDGPELCPACKVGAVVCSVCRVAMRWPSDPAQLPLFNLEQYRPVLVLPKPDDYERYWSFRARASQATKRKYPYH